MFELVALKSTANDSHIFLSLSNHSVSPGDHSQCERIFYHCIGLYWFVVVYTGFQLSQTVAAELLSVTDPPVLSLQGESIQACTGIFTVYDTHALSNLWRI